MHLVASRANITVFFHHPSPVSDSRNQGRDSPLADVAWTEVLSRRAGHRTSTMPL